jgi:hypothetical protein
MYYSSAYSANGGQDAPSESIGPGTLNYDSAIGPGFIGGSTQYIPSSSAAQPLTADQINILSGFGGFNDGMGGAQGASAPVPTQMDPEGSINGAASSWTATTAGSEAAATTSNGLPGAYAGGGGQPAAYQQGVSTFGTPSVSNFNGTSFTQPGVGVVMPNGSGTQGALPGGGSKYVDAYGNVYSSQAAAAAIRRSAKARAAAALIPEVLTPSAVRTPPSGRAAAQAAMSARSCST